MSTGRFFWFSGTALQKNIYISDYVVLCPVSSNIQSNVFLLFQSHVLSQIDHHQDIRQIYAREWRNSINLKIVMRYGRPSGPYTIIIENLVQLNYNYPNNTDWL
jgi:hypothetical protein